MQILNKSKKIKYLEIATLEISQFEFDKICKDISIPNSCYLKYARQSVAKTDGIWRCIILRNEQDARKIILYTAGRTYPLYAAIAE